MIEFDVDMSYLLGSDELDKVILNDEGGEHEPMEFAPADATVGVVTCHMRLAYEEEDADGCIWPDHYVCDACGAKVNGIMLSCDTEIPPKFCPNCGAKVVSR